MDFTDWLQQQAGNVITARTAAKYSAPVDLEKQRLETLGAAYASGQFAQQTNPLAVDGGMGKYLPVLLIGGAVVVAFLLNRD